MSKDREGGRATRCYRRPPLVSAGRAPGHGLFKHVLRLLGKLPAWPQILEPSVEEAGTDVGSSFQFQAHWACPCAPESPTGIARVPLTPPGAPQAAGRRCASVRSQSKGLGPGGPSGT